MFYSQFILAKKGPLATIWIAAHLERKLRKNQIADTNIGESVDSILYPEVPIALRLSGHLLLGVVRIYSRKVNLLFNDCSEALVKIHQAFQSSAVDLPPGAVVAPFNSITLPESFNFDDLDAHLNRENLAAQLGNRNDFEHHVTARDLITLQEQNDDRRSLFSLDERFEDAGNPYAVLDLSIEELAPEILVHSSVPGHAKRMPVEDDVLPPLPMDDEMDFDRMNIDKEIVNSPNVSEPLIEGVTEGLSPFPETTLEVPDVEKLRAVSDSGRQEPLMELEDFAMQRETSVSMDLDDRVPSTQKVSDAGITHNLEETPLLSEDPTPMGLERSSHIRSPVTFSEEHDILGSILGKRTPKLEVAPTPVSTKRGGKKRKLAFDATVSLSSADMKKQLKSTSDICRARRRAPSTEYEIWMSKRDNHVEQSFLEPSFPGLSKELKEIYEGVITEKIVLLEKPPTADQGYLRRTPRRLGLDAKEKIEDSRKITIESVVEEVQNEKIALDMPSVADPDMPSAADPDMPSAADPDMPSAADVLVENVEDVDFTRAQHEEPLSPDGELSFPPVQAMDDEGALDVAREQDEGTSTSKEHLDNSVAQDIRAHEDDAAANLEDHCDSGAPKSQGLGFLADSRDTDEPGYEMAASSKQTGKSFSSDSGWSSRSRAVALYLKDKFDTMEAGADKVQSKNLNLEKLLTGRTRREAARLFFETLVLGTKGYLQVEQACPYADVNLTATQRLLKAAF